MAGPRDTGDQSGGERRPMPGTSSKRLLVSSDRCCVTERAQLAHPMMRGGSSLQPDEAWRTLPIVTAQISGRFPSTHVPVEEPFTASEADIDVYLTVPSPSLWALLVRWSAPAYFTFPDTLQ